jgi:hypothetical protein
MRRSSDDSSNQPHLYVIIELYNWLRHCIHIEPMHSLVGRQNSAPTLNVTLLAIGKPCAVGVIGE